MPEYIDVTPTWAGILSTLLVLLEHGDNNGKHAARLELAKMARLADERNEYAKKLNTVYGNDVEG